MLTDTEIRNLLNDLENERVERTISTNNTSKFSEAVCAFANDIRNSGLPGYLFIGAYDDGSLSGLSVTDELLRNLAALRSEGNILPAPALMVYKVSLPEGDIAVVETQPSLMPPVRYKGKIWIRIGARKAVANEEEERILMEKRQANSGSFDTQPCFDATLEDLDLDLFRNEYLLKAVSADTLENDHRDIAQQLASLRLFSLKHNCPTNAGIILLGKDPRYFIFGDYVQYVRFAGTDRASQVLKENEFSGCLIRVLKDLESFVKYSIEDKRPEFVSVLREKTVVNYPYKAIRELLMNALMHRSYEGSNAPIKFYEYSDRIEIDNPGNLYGKVRIENFPGENDYRNPVIAEAMKTLGYVNRFGRGISMVEEALSDNGSEAAIFKLDDISSFKVTVKSADLGSVKPIYEEIAADKWSIKRELADKWPINEKVADKLVEVIILAKSKNYIRTEDVVSLLSVGETTAKRYLRDLVDYGYLRAEGGNKNRTYYSVEK